ncbi:MAG TPA: 2OG-Fe(II) oxygenase, partial [Polyangiales bacterium]|nr:2OG-Fe(II) oxygenase [Polyangiales bacterium]
MTDVITKVLSQITAPGTFATRLRMPAESLEIEVTGVGGIRFPITARSAQKLCAVARPSPFGLRQQTLHDLSVRNTWEVAASRVKISARSWKPVLTSCLQTVQSELGFPEACELKAVFDKLLIYQEGQFFKPHQDSEKADEMVGTLVVILPSEYSGGTVTVEHRGEKKSFRRVDGQARELSLLAFYADCHHTVSPIKSGVRVALTYQLRLSAAAGAVRPNVPAAVVDRLAAGVQEHFAVPVTRPYGQAEPAAPERLVYLLDHEYTQRSLSWDRLKNGDRARVAALRAAAERLDCECFLGLAEVHEQWLCGDQDDGYRRYGRRRWGYTEEDELPSASEEPELIELQASDIELNRWLDATGQPVAGIGHAVDAEELYFTKPSHDMDPFR